MQSQALETSESSKSPAPALAPGQGRGVQARTVVEAATLPVLLVIAVVFFTLHPDSSDTFLSRPNVNTILQGAAVTGVLALGMLIPLVCGYFDLTTAALATIANVAFASLVSEHGWPMALALIGPVVITTLIALVTAYLVAYIKLDAFVITFGMFTLLGGMAVLYTGGNTIVGGVPISIGQFSAENWLGLPKLFVVMLAIALVIWYGLRHTPVGRALASIGSNERAAWLVGLPVNRYLFGVYVVSGFFGGVAGLMLTAQTGIGDPAGGPSYLFPALAAVFLGATSITPGTFNVPGTVIGLLFVGVAINGLTLLGASGWVQPTFNGLALVLAVTVSTLIRRSRRTG